VNLLTVDFELLGQNTALRFNIFFQTMSWYKARAWCTERGMQLPNLKTWRQVEAVTEELTSRVGCKKE